MLQIPSTDGVTVAVHELGGSGPVILFAHATGFHGAVWRPLARHLTDAFRCLALDSRGHGDSTAPASGDFSWSGFADDVLSVVEELGAPSLFGVGHSKGGAALLLAEQRRPETFEALWCFEPIVIPKPARELTGASVDSHPLAVGARRRRQVFGSRQEAYENYAAKPPLASLHPEALHAYVEHGFADLADGSVQLKCRGEDEAAVYTMSTSHEAFDHLVEVRCPVTVAAGRLEDANPSALAASIAGVLPSGRFERYEQLGHFGPLEDPAFVAARIRDAFSR